LKFTFKKKIKFKYNFNLLSIPLFIYSILNKAMPLLRIHKINLTFFMISIFNIFQE
jgi:hypothetical protein